MIPIILKLKKAQHKEIARAQDLVMEELYKVFEKATLHGGTSIWRCYQGNRFSEDIDVYLPKEKEKLNLFFENLRKKGFTILKKKIGERSVFSTLEFNRTFVGCEAIFVKKEGVLREYVTIDGNFMTIYTLTPKELIKEKIAAYLKREMVRDLYDIFFLLRYVKPEEELKKELRTFLSKFQEPKDKHELRVLIIEGITPEVSKMIEYIQTWCR